MFYEEIYQPKVSYCNRDERLPMKLACEFLETLGRHQSDHARDSAIDGIPSEIASTD